MSETDLRYDWTAAEVATLFGLPFGDLMFRAQTLHRRYFTPNTVQISTLLSIKTGGCPEDCAYCPQSVHYDSGVKAGKLMDLASVTTAAREARNSGATRFCMGAAWREPKDRDLDAVCSMIAAVREIGLETCATLGMLSAPQAIRLKDAGLDFYNHNLDTSPEFYGNVISTRTYDERLATLERVRAAGIRLCCGGIIGMGESDADRAGLIATLARLEPHPESVPINALVRVAGTPLADQLPVDALDFARMVAVARITMPKSVIRLSAGREDMSDEAHALAFLAGANSIFFGPRLLTTPNPAADKDRILMSRLGLNGETSF